MSRHPRSDRSTADHSHTPVDRPPTVLGTTLVPSALTQFIGSFAQRIVDPLPSDRGRPFDLVSATLSAAGLIVLVTGIPPADADLMAVLLAIAAVRLTEFFLSGAAAGSSPTGTLPCIRSNDLALLWPEENQKGVGR